jgi:hypothetical protein
MSKQPTQIASRSLFRVVIYGGLPSEINSDTLSIKHSFLRSADQDCPPAWPLSVGGYLQNHSDMRMEENVNNLKSKAYLSFCFCMILVIFTVTMVDASLTTQTDANGNTAILDSTTGLYWFPDPGYVAGYGSGSYSYVESRIETLNTSNYFGIANWRLATTSNFSTMYHGNTPSDLASSFISTSSSSGSESVSQGSYYCLPYLGCFGTPPVDVTYNEIHWKGILAETTTVATVVYSNPSLAILCPDFPFLPGCESSTIVYDPAHMAADFSFRDYDPPSNISIAPVDLYSWSYPNNA